MSKPQVFFFLFLFLLKKSVSPLNWKSFPSTVFWSFHFSLHHNVLWWSVLFCSGCHYKKLGGLNHRHLFSHRFGDWKSEIKVSAGSVSWLRALSSGCRQMPACYVLKTQRKRESSGISSSSYMEEEPPLLKKSPTLTTSFNYHFLPGPASQCNHIWS